MGVLACDKYGCGNVMCDRYSYEYGYLCNDCFEELCETRPADIAEWMGLVRSHPARPNYEEIFRDRDEW